jgi:phage tail sheath protein FI
MANPLSPGVYVVEAPSGSAPIAGVGTSTPVFLGFYSFPSDPTAFAVKTAAAITSFQPSVLFCSNFSDFKSKFILPPSVLITITTAGALGTAVFSYSINGGTAVQSNATTLSGTATNFVFAVPNSTVTITFAPGTYVANSTYAIDPAGNVTASQPSGTTGTPPTLPTLTATTTTVPPTGLLTLAHAVFGFFQNGGTGCFVTRGRVQTTTTGGTTTTTEADVAAIMALLETFDDIEIVAAPGVTTPATIAAITAHVEKMKDRVALVDVPQPTAGNDVTFYGTLANLPYGTSSYQAGYFPFIEVSPLYSGIVPLNTPYYISALGHIAGLYARVDANRGVHKAPANEVVFGALSVQTPTSTGQQDQVNGIGINLIRQINGNILVWGARTFGGERTNSGLPGGDFKYIHVRRLFNFIRTSIERGTQWTVFEPNTPDLWAKVTRNVSAFLTGLWEQGALFGDTPEQAFYVKCNEETNPPNLRNIGQLNAEIGVNITETAEFVIFHLGQYSPPSA